MRNVRTTMSIFVSLAYGIVGFSCPGIAWAETAPETNGTVNGVGGA